MTDDFIPDQSGPLYSTQLTGHLCSVALQPVPAATGRNRQDAQIGAYSYSGVWLGGGYSQDLPFGFSPDFQPSYFITRYDDELAAFGKTRADNALMLAFNVLNRRFRLPRLHAAIFLCLHRAAQQHSALQLSPAASSRSG